MTDKAQAVLRKMNASRLFGSRDATKQVLDDFNRSTLDDVGPVGGEQGTKLLSEMNSLVDDHDDFVKSLGPSL